MQGTEESTDQRSILTGPNRAIRRRKSSIFWSKHAILDQNQQIIDHFTKRSLSDRKAISRRKEKARRKAAKANW